MPFAGQAGLPVVLEEAPTLSRDTRTVANQLAGLGQNLNAEQSVAVPTSHLPSAAKAKSPRYKGLNHRQIKEIATPNVVQARARGDETYAQMRARLRNPNKQLAPTQAALGMRKGVGDFTAYDEKRADGRFKAMIESFPKNQAKPFKDLLFHTQQSKDRFERELNQFVQELDKFALEAELGSTEWETHSKVYEQIQKFIGATNRFNAEYSQILDLSGIGLKKLPPLPDKVTAIKLANNELTDLVGLPTSASFLDVRNNKLKELPEYVFKQASITCLSEGNPLSETCQSRLLEKQQIFSFAREQIQLSLASTNRDETEDLPLSAVRLPEDGHYHQQLEKLKSTSPNREDRQRFQKLEEWVKSSGPDEQRQTTLKRIIDFHFRINIDGGTPQSLDLSGFNLTTVPPLPRNAVAVDLSNNRLTNMTAKQLAGIQHLRLINNSPALSQGQLTAMFKAVNRRLLPHIDFK